MLLDTELSPKKAALILVDMQNEFLNPDGPLAKAGLLPVNPADRKEFTANASSLAQAMRKANRPIIYVNTAFHPDRKDCFFSPRWHDAIASDSSCLVEGGKSAAVLDELKPGDADFVLTKKGHSAFQHTYLDRLLKSLDAETCLLTGNLLGSMEETIRQGSALGYENILVPDASYPLRTTKLTTLHGSRVLAPDTAEVLDWIKSGTAKPDEKPPSKPALIIVDLQNGSIPNTKISDEQRQEIVQNNLKLAAAMRIHGFPVIYLKGVHGRHPADQAYGKMAEGNRARPSEIEERIEGSWGTDIVDELKPQPGDIVVVKRSNGGFGTTHLHRLLRNLGVQTIMVTGGAIIGCGSDTVREGVGLGYRAIVIPDAMYRPGTRETGAAALADRAEIKSTQDMLAELEEGVLASSKSR